MKKIQALVLMFMAGTTISFSQTALSDPEVAAVAVAANQIDRAHRTHPAYSGQ